jgi:hypothetical protein
MAKPILGACCGVGAVTPQFMDYHLRSNLAVSPVWKRRQDTLQSLVKSLVRASAYRTAQGGV